MPAGRPRVFDVEKALDRALELFWKHGYEGTSMAMLTETLGINAPSLYATFGNKEALFRKALERYLAVPACYMAGALEEPTARGVAEKVLNGSLRLATDPAHPAGGCLLVRGAIATGPQNDAIRDELSAVRAAGETAMRERFQRAIEEEDLPQGADASKLARYLMTLNSGFAVQAAGGATREQLEEVAEMALQSWPFETG